MTSADDDGIPGSDLQEMFGDLTPYGIFRDVDVDEVIERIAGYEARKEADEEIKCENEIKVRDEVKMGNNIGIVLSTAIDSVEHKRYRCIWSDGRTSTEFSAYGKLAKTGRHFDQIAEVLKQMREG